MPGIDPSGTIVISDFTTPATGFLLLLTGNIEQAARPDCQAKHQSVPGLCDGSNGKDIAALSWKLEVVIAEIATLKADNAALRAKNAHFAIVVDRVHHPISYAVSTKHWWKHFALRAIEPGPAKKRTSVGRFPTGRQPTAGRTGLSIKDLRDRIQKLNHSRIGRDLVAHEVTLATMADSAVNWDADDTTYLGTSAATVRQPEAAQTHLEVFGPAEYYLAWATERLPKELKVAFTDFVNGFCQEEE
ncbi:hypothetical protein FN846DRAFT_887402 [Sphaerosporella brunnea]|uniref:Uncharacterized protein n=1 Tax=Sphaerosporella brunnea TaxID=1250544 RepID=A0A5J5F6G5_9PEZI|nr:hypothetical protein FN846DRAFT_887402 [Sphaerosporella brunnea]